MWAVAFWDVKPGQTFTVNGRALGSVEQRDLGVNLYSSLKVASHADRLVKKAFGTLAFISQGIKWEEELKTRGHRFKVRGANGTSLDGASRGMGHGKVMLKGLFPCLTLTKSSL